ncbi:hypothetical protein COCMIDRAFT_25417 [Bipolaris oryzae ATCC 44560]|uniref:Uncharacterized protein n=1 Tax=Bipolaris oryzae ATCC 44560 TaxID=930090 RepID=W6Z9Y4_COCMI|nr:uncharacterized protein COCMIDRAFT_25417 [Bipolaris oryzae ATCC 44560]EUC46588.1 hypothetical protein COCMIDRAFT_25417 [Bipolaris oryzae ATCC 44560]
MRSIASIAQEHFGISTYGEALKLELLALKENDPPRTTPTHLSIPYTADNCPEDPPQDEFQKAVTENTLHAAVHMNYVFRVRDQVFKVGDEQQIIEEAENLIYLAENSRVRVPKVYKLTYTDWMSSTEEERTTLCARLREQYRLLRSIPSEGYYGRVHCQAFDRKMGMFRTNCKQSCGPYKTYEEFTSAVIRSAEVNALIRRVQEGEYLCEDQDTMLSEYKQALEISADRKPVFTHVDPSLKNIILRRIPSTQDQPPDWEVTLIDWAGAGWYPAWVQGAAFDQRFGFWDESGKFHADIDDEFVDKVFGEMKCGADLARLCTKAQRIY